MYILRRPVIVGTSNFHWPSPVAYTIFDEILPAAAICTQETSSQRRTGTCREGQHYRSLASLIRSTSQLISVGAEWVVWAYVLIRPKKCWDADGASQRVSLSYHVKALSCSLVLYMNPP